MNNYFEKGELCGARKENVVFEIILGGGGLVVNGKNFIFVSSFIWWLRFELGKIAFNWYGHFFRGGSVLTSSSSSSKLKF